MNQLSRLREALPDLRMRLHMGAGNLKKQLKKADASGGTVALIFDSESADGSHLTLKHLRDAELGQETLEFASAIERLRDQCRSQ